MIYKFYVGAPVNNYQLIATYIDEDDIEYIDWVQSNINNDLTRTYIEEVVRFHSEDYQELKVINHN